MGNKLTVCCDEDRTESKIKILDDLVSKLEDMASKRAYE